MAESEPLILDGKLVAAKLTENLRGEVDALSAMGHTPGLAVVLVGSNPASQVYVRNKVRTCAEVGMRSEKIELPEGTTQMELLAVVERLNRDEGIHGILVQSPVPGGIDEAAVVRAIDPAKDVDGFHPVNVARLAMGDDGAFVPCTPLGCLALLEHYGIPLAGANVVILGRSLIVGKPLALLLMRKGVDATVTVAHSRSRDLERITRGADIVVAAMGVPEFVGGRHLREGQVVIDVGINRVADAGAAKGWRLTGDVNFSEATKVCRAITPVPGGVGPMTIALLLQNTVKACRERTAGG